MTLAQIKAALKRGRRVYWANKNYEVYRDANGRLEQAGAEGLIDNDTDLRLLWEKQ